MIFRQKWIPCAAVILAFCSVTIVQAADTYSHAGLFANAKEVFKPLLADPREIQMAMRLNTPVGHKNLGDIAVGEYFGLYRWVLPWEESYIQWSVAGGVFGRFDLVSVEKESEVIDFAAEMPVDLRFKKWSLRLLPYHISSHLGDDFIKRTGILPDKYSLDSFKWLVGYEPWKWLRLYGGVNYIIRNRKSDLGRFAVQTGAEWSSGWWAGGHAQTFFATDFESWERVHWNPETTTQLGIRIANSPEDRQALALFTEYGAGHLAYGQLFEQKESHWIAGLRLEFP